MTCESSVPRILPLEKKKIKFLDLFSRARFYLRLSFPSFVFASRFLRETWRTMT
jgi:hypothetical protein